MPRTRTWTAPNCGQPELTKPTNVQRDGPICDCGVICKAIDTVEQRTRAMSERVEDCGGAAGTWASRWRGRQEAGASCPPCRTAALLAAPPGYPQVRTFITPQSHGRGRRCGILGSIIDGVGVRRMASERIFAKARILEIAEFLSAHQAVHVSDLAQRYGCLLYT